MTARTGKNSDFFSGPRTGLKVLLVSGSHGFPATQARFARAYELAKELVSRGAAVHWVVLVERTLEYFEEDDLLSFRALVQRLSIIDHPQLYSPFFRFLSRIRERLGVRVRLGGRSHVPRRLLRFLRARAAESPDVAIVSGEHLASALRLFGPATRKVLDLPRIGSEAYKDHAANGRGEDLQVFADDARETCLLGLADAAICACEEDALTLQARGYRGGTIVVPPAGEFLSGAFPSRRGPGVLGSSALLYVGSPTAANLDGLFWFRKHVLPRLLETSRVARLRVVGDIARYMDPTPGVDRLGRVDDLESEYRGACAVVLPLRMGSGVHRRAVEAIVRGKVLCTTRLGAVGTGLVPDRDAIVTDDPARMARELSVVLSDPEVRRRFEAASYRIAQNRFDPKVSCSRLVSFLTEREPLEAAVERLGVPSALPV